jgi:NADPH:quinone reductase-like Zn-dependent oxidoreductase
MNAICIHFFGGSDVLTLEEVPAPQPAEGEVLIKVQAAGVNPVDYKMRAGKFRADGQKPPMILGREVSGVIERVGGGTGTVKTGDGGGYAEYAVAKVQEIAAKPAAMDHVHSAAVPLAALTAWQGLFDHGGLQAGERVLIHGAAGGVGHFAVQFAKQAGAYVVTNAKAEDTKLLFGLGADEVIDCKTERFEERTRDIDLVFDLVAGYTQQRSWTVLKEGGRIVSTLQPPAAEEGARHHAQGKVFKVEPKPRQLMEIARLIDAGVITVVLDQALPLAEARRAHDHLENDHVRGKVVLTVAA